MCVDEEVAPFHVVIVVDYLGYSQHLLELRANLPTNFMLMTFTGTAYNPQVCLLQKTCSLFCLYVIPDEGHQLHEMSRWGLVSIHRGIPRTSAPHLLTSLLRNTALTFNFPTLKPTNSGITALSTSPTSKHTSGLIYNRIILGIFMTHFTMGFSRPNISL